jgi:ferric-dicitrate binding protein FerR (iron transport regulator)
MSLYSLKSDLVYMDVSIVQKNKFFLMNSNPIIPPENESRWVAFLNGEPEISDPSNQEAEDMIELTSVWEAAGTSFSNSKANPSQAWSNLQKELNLPKHKFKIELFKSRILKYAAMILMTFAVGFATYEIVKTPVKRLDIPLSMAVATTEAHPLKLTIITLPDGSVVKLNASTRIEYPVHFAAKIRKVKLSGEAFFEVTRDTLHPFIIETENASVEVLGTSFNVSAYPNAEMVEVNVKTGIVKLTQHINGSSVHKSALLPAGKRGWVNIKEDSIGQDMILSPNYSAWITKELIFQRTPLVQAFGILENTYHVKISMENPGIGKIPYTANFYPNQKLDYIIEVIARTHKLKVKRKADEIIFARAEHPKVN